MSKDLFSPLSAKVYGAIALHQLHFESARVWVDGVIVMHRVTLLNFMEGVNRNLAGKGRGGRGRGVQKCRRE